MLVTIRGLLGSGASDIGREVARMIQCDYVDREILEKVARLMGQPIEEVAKSEQISHHLAERIVAVLSKVVERSGSSQSAYTRSWEEPLDKTAYLDALISVIEELALEQKIVIQGRGSQFILRHFPSALHVLVVAPIRERINRVMAKEETDEEGAKKLIDEYDGTRRAFIQKFFKRDIENSDYYDLVVNTKNMEIHAAARIIVNAAQEKNPW